jgi:hypothetical protein
MTLNVQALRGFIGMMLLDLDETTKRQYLTNLNPMVTPVNIDYYLEGNELDVMVTETIVLMMLAEGRECN